MFPAVKVNKNCSNGKTGRAGSKPSALGLAGFLALRWTKCYHLGMLDNNPQSPLRRRDFLTRLALVTAGLSGLGALISSLRLAIPRVFSSNRTIRIGRGVDFPMGVATFVEEGESYVLRSRDGIRVFSGTCPHLGCVVRRTDMGFRCPCHGSEFGPLGERRSGPAPHRLKRLPVRLAEGDQLELDLTRILPIDEPPLRLPLSRR